MHKKQQSDRFSDLSIKDRRAIAAKCGIVDAYLYQILAGYREPSAALAVAIEQATAKRIKRQDLIEGWAQVWPELI